jgi:hypothetical protein
MELIRTLDMDDFDGIADGASVPVSSGKYTTGFGLVANDSGLTYDDLLGPDGVFNYEASRLQLSGPYGELPIDGLFKQCADHNDPTHGKFFGTCKTDSEKRSKYVQLSNRDKVMPLLELQDKGLIRITRANTWSGGKNTLINCEVPSLNDAEHRFQLLNLDSLGADMGNHWMSHFQRLICKNQIPSIKRNAKEGGLNLKTAHNATLNQRVDDIHKAIEHVASNAEEYYNTMYSLKGRECSEGMLNEILDRIAPKTVKNKTTKLMEYSTRAENIRASIKKYCRPNGSPGLTSEVDGTLYAALQGITYHFSNEATSVGKWSQYCGTPATQLNNAVQHVYRLGA